ncbi:MAG: 30S ribosome-binding factor RbfA [Bryobacteraceae bacterium]
MKPVTHRGERIAEALRQELEELINYELADPRIQGATVTEVVLTPDLRKAVVRLSAGDDRDQHNKTLDALENARHFLRRTIGQRLDLYRLPELHFEMVLPNLSAARAGRLLRKVRKGRPRD